MNWEKKKINAVKGVSGFQKKLRFHDKKITSYYTESERKEITDYCKKNGLTLTEFTRVAIYNYLKSNK